MTEGYVVPSALTRLRREKTRRLEVGDGVVVHDPDGREVNGLVAYPGTKKVPVQIAGGWTTQSLPVQWEEGTQ